MAAAPKRAEAPALRGGGKADPGDFKALAKEMRACYVCRLVKTYGQARLRARAAGAGGRAARARRRTRSLALGDDRAAAAAAAAASSAASCRASSALAPRAQPSSHAAPPLPLNIKTKNAPPAVLRRRLRQLPLPGDGGRRRARAGLHHALLRRVRAPRQRAAAAAAWGGR